MPSFWIQLRIDAPDAVSATALAEDLNGLLAANMAQGVAMRCHGPLNTLPTSAPMHREVAIYTDGGCAQNPYGPGGWGYVRLEQGLDAHEGCGGEPATTNNRMELMAAIAALEHLPEEENFLVTVYADSQYVIRGITQRIHGWRKYGWKTQKGEPVKNADLWARLWDASRRHTVKWVWVKGHAGDPWNERADQLATRGMHEAQFPVPLAS